MTATTWRSRLRGAAAALLLLLVATGAAAQDEQGLRLSRKGEVAGMTDAEVIASMPEYFKRDSRGRVQPTDIPDIYGPGAVLNVGNVAMKVTNFGMIGNNWPYLSTDPAGQWPGVSGVEYLTAFTFAVGGVNPTATDPNAARRVSHFTEWRPPTMEPVDKIYKAYDGILSGSRNFDDDKDSNDYPDPWDKRKYIDEDFLDGHDNDLDGETDEDFAALGQQMFTCVIRDDTPQALNATYNEKHVALGLECQQAAWAYSINPNTEFNIVQWTVFNRSGHMLDSLVVGGVVDLDCGPIDKSNYWSDDRDLVGYPSGVFPHEVEGDDMRRQHFGMRDSATVRVPRDSSLCSHFDVRIHGFSIVDDDGDLGKTPGLPSFLLVDHTVDPSGVTGPARVGFTSWRSYANNPPYAQGGYPRTDQQKFESMVGASQPQVDEDGMVTQEPGAEKGDYQTWWSCGPWRNVPDGGSIQVTVAFTVAPGTFRDVQSWGRDYVAYRGLPDGPPKEAALASLMSKYKSLANAYAVQVAAEGKYEDRPEWAPMLTNGHGRETVLHPKPGDPLISGKGDCHDDSPRPPIDYYHEDWFDFDCDYCTGAYNSKAGRGMFHHTWLASAPPPNPNLNVASNYNYSDNPNRVAPAGDNQITLAWDNSSETTKDPKTGEFDCRGYRIWKAANWTRPVGSAGPSDEDWALLGEYRLFYLYEPRTYQLIERNYEKLSETDSICPRVFVPSWHYPKGSLQCTQPDAQPASDGGCFAPTSRHYPMGSPQCLQLNAQPASDGGCFVPDSVDICLRAGDLWDHQTGHIIHPAPIDCKRDRADDCIIEDGYIVGPRPKRPESRVSYPVGRYQYVDREVKNGFVYFYSVTALDSTVDDRGVTRELSGRRSAAEGDMVVPQWGTRPGGRVWVVPNPYRGFRSIQERPSSWDLTPNGSDPTGTHVDFLGMPRGRWSIKIFTVSGDLVQTLRSEDPVNESIRSPVPGPNDTTLPGYNRQQDNPNDGQARWNLISRNGQDIVSGIYLFVVESDSGTQRGRFVVIR